MDSNELLEKFERELPNGGKWNWEGNEGGRPRTLTVVHKLLKAGLKEALVKELVTDLYFTAFVEYEKSVYNRTGIRVKDIPMKRAPEPEPAIEQPKADVVAGDI